MGGDRIRFIDSKYQTLFYVPDGGSIIITQPDGERSVKPCAFLDEYHALVGCRPYHICEFAELMKRAGNTYAPGAAGSLLFCPPFHRGADFH